MIYKMRLKNGPFKAIKSGTKKVELRLNDEKRKLIKEHDIIEFENRITLEKIEVEVIKLHHFDSFSELYKHFDKISIGYKADEIANPEDMDKYYSKEEQAKYGVVGIEIKLIDLEKIYNKIKTDSLIIDMYKEIEEVEDNEGGWAYHNYEHVKNVTDIVEQVLQKLNYDNNFILKAKIAAILHDVGSKEGKENHAIRSYEFVKKYFDKNNIKFIDIDKVLEAIKIHSDGFDTDNIIALAIILGDKLDVKKNRISKEGQKVIGNRQFYHVLDIKINIENNNMIIKFITDGEIDIKELNEYYFTKKIFKAINAFSIKLNLTLDIYIDENEWEINF